MLWLFQRGLCSCPHSRSCCSVAARGCGASRGLSPPLQSMPGAQYSNSSVMLLILGEAHGKYYFVQYKQVNRGLCRTGDACSTGGNWEFPLWAWQAGKRINRHHYIIIIAVESASAYIIFNAWEISHSFKIIKSGINLDARQRLPNY